MTNPEIAPAIGVRHSLPSPGERCMTKIDKETIEIARWYAEKTPKQRQLFREFMHAVAAGRNLSQVEARVRKNWIAAGHVQS